jgi:hypothetical protein
MSSDCVAPATHGARMAASTGPTSHGLTPHELRRVAVEAGCDPRSVRRYLDGEPGVSTLSDRIRRTLDTLGYRHTRRSRTP